MTKTTNTDRINQLLAAIGDWAEGRHVKTIRQSSHRGNINVTLEDGTWNSFVAPPIGWHETADFRLALRGAFPDARVRTYVH